MITLHWLSCHIYSSSKLSLNDDLFISCDDRIGKMLHNILISAVVMSLRWGTRGPWASCTIVKIKKKKMFALGYLNMTVLPNCAYVSQLTLKFSRISGEFHVWLYVFFLLTQYKTLNQIKLFSSLPFFFIPWHTIVVGYCISIVACVSVCPFGICPSVSIFFPDDSLGK